MPELFKVRWILIGCQYFYGFTNWKNKESKRFLLIVPLCSYSRGISMIIKCYNYSYCGNTLRVVTMYFPEKVLGNTR